LTLSGFEPRTVQLVAQSLYINYAVAVVYLVDLAGRTNIMKRFGIVLIVGWNGGYSQLPLTLKKSKLCLHAYEKGVLTKMFYLRITWAGKNSY